MCSRCTGIYLASFSYFALATQVPLEYPTAVIIIALVLIIPTVIDGFTQFLGWRLSKNSIRFSTGILAGIGLAILVKAVKHSLLV